MKDRCELCNKQTDKLKSLKKDFKWDVCESCYEEYTLGVYPHKDIDIIERRLTNGCK